MYKRILVYLILSLLSFVGQACEFPGVTFDGQFPGARLVDCSKLNESHFSLSFPPENRPINNSPWYAFKVKSNEPRQVSLSLTFDGNAPRYLPKISYDGKKWQGIPFTTDDTSMTIKVALDKRTLWVAGQEIVDNQDYADWLKNTDFLTSRQVLLGNSTEGRPIPAVYFQSPKNKEWVVLIGRQHPPEVTGALAMFPFVESLFDKSDVSRQFRERFNLLIVPNLNPDGVEHGNWRHNVNGKDLNRDWKNFEQVETRLVRDAIKKLYQNGERMVFALDFHSTQQDVFYTMPWDYPLAPQKLVNNWLAILKEKTKSSFVVRPKPGTSPGRGIFKQYIADTYNVQAVTYEMGDNTDRKLIPYVADKAAKTMMDALLAIPSEGFIYRPGGEIDD